jgi:hypothetical protein
MTFSTDPVEGLNQFFNEIWGSVEGFVYSPVKDSTNNWKKYFFPWPSGKRVLVDHVLAHSASNRDVYFSPVIWSAPKSPLSRENIKGSNVVWADFDGSYPEDWTTPRQQAGSDVPGAVPGHPSVTVQSSTEDHQHVYWKLDKLSSDLQLIQDINRAIAYTYGADASGWDIEQILRPPFTTNYKHGTPVLLSSFDRTHYSISQFKSFKPVKQLVREVDLSKLPDPVEVIGKYIWSADTLDLLQKSNKEIKMDRSGAMMRITYTSIELGMTDQEAYSLLFWLDEKWEKFKYRGDRQRRLLDMINKARQKYPHKLEDLTFSGLHSDEAAVTNVKYIYNFKEFIEQPPPVQDWVVRNLLSEQSVNLIAGPPNVGKTQLMLNFATHIAISRDVIGYTPTGRRKNLFLSLEMGRPGLYRLASLMKLAFTPEEIDILSTNFLLCPFGEAIPIHRPEGRKFLESLIEEYKPEGIYIDSLGKVLLGDLNNDEKVREFFAYLNYLKQKYGVHFIIIHHTRKPQDNNKRPRELGDIYGSQYITAEPDTVMSLWPEEKNIISVREVKNRFAEQKEPFNIMRLEHLRFIKVTDESMQIQEEANAIRPSTATGNNSGELFKFK